jgi:hypothetical protein
MSFIEHPKKESQPLYPDKCYNHIMNFESLKQHLRHLHPNIVRQHPMLRDPISLAVLIVSATVNVLTTLLLVAKLHRVDYPVPTHYLSLVGFDAVGGWYNNYRLAVFGVIVTIINGSLAAKSFQRNRLASFYLLIGAAAISVLCLVISSAFAEIV